MLSVIDVHVTAPVNELHRIGDRSVSVATRESKLALTFRGRYHRSEGA